MMKTILFAVLLALLPFFAIANDDLTDDASEEAKYENSPRAQYTLGLMYLQGEGVAQDKKLALSWLKKSADQGYYLALNRLGEIYLNNKVAKADPVATVKYITMAAQKGYSPSQYLLGTLYQTGQQGLAKNRQAALKWFKLAADQGYKKAKQRLAKLSTGDVGKPSRGVEGASISAQAAYDKGFKFLKGEGVSRDYKQAAKWFSVAAEQGLANAQYNLGELYNKGRGVRKNKKIAQKWYKAAAAQGHIKAKYRTRSCAYC